MSNPNVRPTNGPVARTEEERKAHFEELMRIEKSHTKPPVSGMAVAALVFGLLGGFLGVVFAIAALIQIRQGDRRGMPFVIVALVAFAGWATYFTMQVV